MVERMAGARQRLVDEKSSNILESFVELSMKDRFHLFNIITTTSRRKGKEFVRDFLDEMIFSYATMMQNYNTEWPPAEALKEHVGG